MDKGGCVIALHQEPREPTKRPVVIFLSALAALLLALSLRAIKKVQLAAWPDNAAALPLELGAEGGCGIHPQCWHLAQWLEGGMGWQWTPHSPASPRHGAPLTCQQQGPLPGAVSQEESQGREIPFGRSVVDRQRSRVGGRCRVTASKAEEPVDHLVVTKAGCQV